MTPLPEYWPFLLTGVHQQAWEYLSPPDPATPERYRKLVVRPEKILVITNDVPWYEALGGTDYLNGRGVHQLHLSGTCIEAEQVRHHAKDTRLLVYYPRTGKHLSSHLTALTPRQPSDTLSLTCDEGRSLNLQRQGGEAKLSFNLPGAEMNLSAPELLSLLGAYLGLLPHGGAVRPGLHVQSLPGEIKVQCADRRCTLHLPLGSLREQRTLNFLAARPPELE